MRLKKNEKGVILIAAYGVVAVLLVLGSIFFSRSLNEKNSAQRYKNSACAFYAAEAGVDRVKQELYDVFFAYFDDLTPSGGGRRANAFTWFDNLPQLPDGSDYPFPLSASLGNGTYGVDIYDDDGNVDTNKFSVVSTARGRDVTLTVKGEVDDVTRTLTVVLRYELATSGVFEYIYFINNYGWFYGSGITSNGDIRSNGDFAFQSNPTVNGDVYAAVNDDLGAAGDITGSNKNDTISHYRSHSPDEARPTNPTAEPEDINGNAVLDPGEDVNGNGLLDDFCCPNGYDGQSERFPQQDILTMPYLGDLQTYKNYAVAENGTIKQDGVTLVDNVLDDKVVLIGTAAHPIVIHGPVVVTGDVLIKGVVTGRGTLYSGRNTHIIGNITYANPPAWTKPDTDPDATDIANAAKDFLGLATRGNVIIGDYTDSSWDSVKYYLKPSFTQPYEVDASDSDIGYVTSSIDGHHYFHGDYTADDGGTKDDGSNRKYYESSYSDINFGSFDPHSSITRIDAVTYTNHAFTGRVGNLNLNGAIVSRDEAICCSGIKINYDLRAKTMGDSFYLPQSLELPSTVVLEE